MIKDKLHEPFEVLFKKVDECPIDGQTFSFFRFVYIVSGNGKQRVNNNQSDYKAGSLFLLTPDDYHTFDVESTTEFLLISFNNIYIQNKGLDSTCKQRMEFILQNANHNPGCILYNKSDKLLVKSIAESIIREYVNRDLYSKDLVQQLINTLIVIVARNIAAYLPEKISENTDEKAFDILQYIQTNIASPSKIRIDEISRHFGISESYVGRYFKKHTNETMQQYITNYRIKMIENRLLHSDMRITEIAFELGFTDESHLYKFFKKKKGVAPSEFRKK
ncbi:AraC family transcriptional regulator [Dysgonomonas sp. HDW5B]|uniref:AraC family transcriptional regulator n=1 Tax=Dysgonomonas sp. HDW5B TaxID=2714927 RepID=UPI001409E4E7|nr:AraC family transcriptional regulator [Dysgonomonas sp. HDW5B]QIK53142.1 AraC family transcriptional regulator [Dysgonomonas sp. HDW5B]